MPASDDDRAKRPRAGRVAGADEPAAAQLPPTVMTELDDVLLDGGMLGDDGDEPPDIAGEATRALGAPPTDPEGDAVSTEPIDRSGGLATDPPPPYIAPPDVVTPRGLVPPPRTASELAHRPAPDARELAAARREKIARGAVFASIGAAIALGVFVIAAHLFGTGGEADSGPILIVAAAADAPPERATPDPRDAPAITIDRSASIEELERIAARELAAGNRADAAAVYAVLAERAPHRRAFVAAARVLEEQSR
jgi:hypothetical protein